MKTLTINVAILKILGLLALEETNPLRYAHFLYRLISYFLLIISVLDLLNVYTRSISLINFVDIFPVAHISISAWLKASIFIFINRKIREKLLPMMEGFQKQKQVEIFIRKLLVAATIVSTIPVSIALLRPRVHLNDKLVPFHSSLPFNYKDESQYIISYAYQSICGYYIIFIDFQIPFFLISIFIHCAHQLRVVQTKFREVINEMSVIKIKSKSRRDRKNYLSSKMNFRKTVKHHSHILRFIRKANQQLSVIMLLELISTLFLFGISIINATQLANSALIGYLIINVIKFFLTTYYSELMTYESVQISNILYMAHWEKQVIDIQKDVIFIIQRSQRQAYVTYMFFNKFGLNVFLWMLKASYSYYTLLQQKLKEQNS